MSYLVGAFIFWFAFQRFRGRTLFTNRPFSRTFRFWIAKGRAYRDLDDDTIWKIESIEGYKVVKQEKFHHLLFIPAFSFREAIVLSKQMADKYHLMVLVDD